MERYIKAVKQGSEGWNRPEGWAPRPEGWEDKKGVYWLVENVGYNLVYFQCNKPVDIYVNDVLEISLTANQGQTTIIELFEQDYTPIVYGGRNWLWVYFDVEDGATISTYTNSSALVGNKSGIVPASSSRSVSVVEEIINLDSVVQYNQNDPGAVWKINKLTENVYFREGCVVSIGTYLFSTLPNLTNIENYPIINIFGNHMYRGTTFTNNGVIDLFNVPDEIRQIAYRSWYFKSIKFINTSSVTALTNAFTYSYASFIEVEDCSNVTIATQALTYASYIKGFKFNNLGVSFIVNGTSILEYGLIQGIESLKDMTGEASPTMTVFRNTDLNTPAVIAAASAKNWTLAFTV